MNLIRNEVTILKKIVRKKSALALLKRNPAIHACLVAGGISHILYISSRKVHCENSIPVCSVVNSAAAPGLVDQEPSTVWKSVKRAAKWLADFIRLVTRLGLLGLCFAPTVLSAPVLLAGSQTLEQAWWELLRYAIFASGPCLTKFAQWAATRPDIFNPKLCKELEFLQAQSYEHSWSATDNVLQKVYGKHWHRRLRLDQVSVTGSGLVAQVYHGYLLNEQQEPLREVAVKVLHPGVKAAMVADLALLRFVAHCTEDLAMLVSWLWRGGADGNHDTINRESILETTFSLAESVEEFSELMRAQLDLQREGESLLRFKRNFSNSKWAERVVFAEPVQIPGELPSSPYKHDVLIETFQRGQPMADFLRRRDTSKPTKRDRDIAGLGLDIILKMIFDDNFIHGDLHPGNLLLNGNQDEPGRLTVLDTGLCTELKPQDRKNLLLLFKAVLDRDGSQVGRLIVEKSRCRRSRQRVIDPEGFQRAMQEVIDDAFHRGLTPANRGVTILLTRVLELCYKHRVRLESGFASVILSVGVVEGLGMQLDPSIDILSRAAPFILRAAARDYGLL